MEGGLIILLSIIGFISLIMIIITSLVIADVIDINTITTTSGVNVNTINNGGWFPITILSFSVAIFIACVISFILMFNPEEDFVIIKTESSPVVVSSNEGSTLTKQPGMGKVNDSTKTTKSNKMDSSDKTGKPVKLNIF